MTRLCYQCGRELPEEPITLTVEAPGPRGGAGVIKGELHFCRERCQNDFLDTIQS